MNLLNPAVPLRRPGEQPEGAMMRLVRSMESAVSIQQYGFFVDTCFEACAFNFRTERLADKEELCLSRCFQKVSDFVRVSSVALEDDNIHRNLQQQQQQQQK